MFKRLIGKECVNADCKRLGEILMSGAVCEECGSILKPIEKWNWRVMAALGILLVSGGWAIYHWHGTPRETKGSGMPPLPTPAATSSVPTEITLSYAFELQGENQTVSLVAADHVFRSGDRFRVVFKADFNAHVYLFNQNPDDANVQVLYPVAAKTATLQANAETRTPGTEGWFRMDPKAGNEVLILVASPNPLPALERTGEAVRRREFDSWLAQTEEGGRPKSQRLFQNSAWCSLMTDASQKALVFVHRIPLRHD
jgi:hypothetical protein